MYQISSVNVAASIQIYGNYEIYVPGKHPFRPKLRVMFKHSACMFSPNEFYSFLIIKRCKFWLSSSIHRPVFWMMTIQFDSHFLWATRSTLIQLNFQLMKLNIESLASICNCWYPIKKKNWKLNIIIDVAIWVHNHQIELHPVMMRFRSSDVYSVTGKSTQQTIVLTFYETACSYSLDLWLSGFS